MALYNPYSSIKQLPEVIGVYTRLSVRVYAKYLTVHSLEGSSSEPRPDILTSVRLLTVALLSVVQLVLLVLLDE